MSRAQALLMVDVFSLFRRRTPSRAASPRRAPPKRIPLPPDNGDWTCRRAPPREQDTTLSSTCTAWLDRLPQSVLPANLCMLYPAIANRLALCWSDPVLTERVFDDLLLDRRGGRRGFPPPVASDLLRLRLHHAQRHIGAKPYSPWDRHSLAVSDR